MGWKARGSRAYWYWSERQGDRVVSRYIGGGFLGRAAAMIADDVRFDREWKRERARRAADRIEAEDRESAEAFKAVDRSVATLMASEGYRQHDRGRWRKARGRMGIEIQIDKPPDEHIREGKAALDRLLDRMAAFDVSAAVRVALISPLAGREEWAEGSLALQAERMAEGLVGPDAPLVEKLLADRVVACWLDLAFCDLQAAPASKRIGGEKGVSEFWDKRRDRASRRFIRSMQALAQVQRLDLGRLHKSREQDQSVKALLADFDRAARLNGPAPAALGRDD